MESVEEDLVVGATLALFQLYQTMSTSLVMGQSQAHREFFGLAPPSHRAEALAAVGWTT